jgi:hypothetical protein
VTREAERDGRVSLASRRDGRVVRAARHGRRDEEHARGKAFFESFFSARRGFRRSRRPDASEHLEAPATRGVVPASRRERETLEEVVGGGGGRARRTRDGLTDSDKTREVFIFE